MTAPTRDRGNRRRQRTRSQRLQRSGRGFKIWSVLPMVALLLLFSVYPLVQLFVMSFANVSYRAGSRVWAWIGLGNYERALTDEVFWISVRQTFLYVIGSISIEFVLGLALALAATRIRRFGTIYRTVLMLPLLVPPIAVATAWRLMYDANFGLFNQVAMELGIAPQYWLTGHNTALWAVIAVSIWYWTSYVFLLLLAGLQSIPGHLYEVAKIDGATGPQLFRHLTLPLLVPAILVTLLFRTINGFKVFDIIYALTNGGPGVSTEVINTYVYKVFISQQQLGYGASLAAIAILVVAVISMTYNAVFPNRSIS